MFKKKPRILFEVKVLAIWIAAVFTIGGIDYFYVSAGDDAGRDEMEGDNFRHLIEIDETLSTDTEPETQQKKQDAEKRIEQDERCGMARSVDLDSEDEDLLAKIAMAEAGCEDVEGKALVILTVMNRVESDEFPDTVSEVLYQEGQFSPVGDGFDMVEPDNECYEALQLVQAEQWDESQGALYFESEGKSSWHRNNLQFLFQHGNHCFYTDKELEE